MHLHMQSQFRRIESISFGEVELQIQNCVVDCPVPAVDDAEARIPHVGLLHFDGKSPRQPPPAEPRNHGVGNQVDNQAHEPRHCSREPDVLSRIRTISNRNLPKHHTPHWRAIYVTPADAAEALTFKRKFAICHMDQRVEASPPRPSRRMI